MNYRDSKRNQIGWMVAAVIPTHSLSNRSQDSQLRIPRLSRSEAAGGDRPGEAGGLRPLRGLYRQPVRGPVLNRQPVQLGNDPFGWE